MTCAMNADVEALAQLLKQLFERRPYTDGERERVIRLVRQWHATECDDYCELPRCPYLRRQDDWLQFEGFVDLYAVLMRTTTDDGVIKITKPRGGDIMDNPAARRPGHFNG